MTATVLAFPTKPRGANSFGDCPHCGQTTGFFNIGPEQWCYCDRHQTKWCFGENLLSSWRHETEETWRLNDYRFGPYRAVEPVYLYRAPKELGASLARFCDDAEETARREIPDLPPRCESCVFRKGGLPTAQLFALRCVVERIEFPCVDRKGHPCSAWALMMLAVIEATA